MSNTVTLSPLSANQVTMSSRAANQVVGSWPQVDGPLSVVIVLMDDVGMEQLSAYASVNRWPTGPAHPFFHYPSTPWIDSIAARGVVFDYCYASPVCSPTRAQVLTGRYPHQRTGHAGTGIGDLCRYDYSSNTDAPVTLQSSMFPLAGVLAAADKPIAWGSIAEGKWHLGNGFRDPTNPTVHGGFEFYHGALGSPNIENDGPETEPPYTYSGGHYNWWLTQASGSAFSQTYKADKFMASEEFKKLRNWVSSRNDDEPFVIYWATHSAHSTLLPVKDGYGPDGETMQTTFTEAEQDSPGGNANIGMRRNHSHIEAIDYLCGELEDAIPAALRARTVWIFLADNGSEGAAVLTPQPEDFWNAGDDQPPPGYYDPTKEKGTMFDPGIRIPCIIGGEPIAAAVQGTRYTSGPVDIVDIYPTVLDLVCPSWRAYLEAQDALDEVDGISLLPVLTGGKHARNHSLAQKFTPNGATLGEEETALYAVTNRNRWKLIINDGVESLFYLGGTGGDGHGYAADPTEDTDLIGDPSDAVLGEYADLKTYYLEEVLGQIVESAPTP